MRSVGQQADNKGRVPTAWGTLQDPQMLTDSPMASCGRGLSGPSQQANSPDVLSLQAQFQFRSPLLLEHFVKQG